jgi:hypothetical protein
MAELLQRDYDLIRLAREIAIDHYDIEDLLDRYQLTYEHWLTLWSYPRFTRLLASEEESWRSAKNTRERVKLKSAAVIETYLEDAAKSLLDAKETLVAKTGLAKLIASFAGIGTEHDQKHGGVGGFSIVINLGDRTLNIGARSVENRDFGVENGDNYTEIDDNYVENDDFQGAVPIEEALKINADLG